MKLRGGFVKQVPGMFLAGSERQGVVDEQSGEQKEEKWWVKE